MRTSSLFIMAAALLVVSPATSADESSGHFYTHPTSQSKATLPDGNTSVLWQYYILGVTGGGTFVQTHDFGEGSSGTSKYTYKMPWHSVTGDGGR